MDSLDLSLPSLPANLALDEALLLEAEAGRQEEVLRFWEWPAFGVVLGAGCQLAVDVDEPACAAASVPICRRASGGGTVLLGPGCLCFTLILRYDRDPALREIPSSYAFILDRVRAALGDLLPAIELAGTSDLAAGDWKFSGNAQQRKRHHLLHHGSLLYSFAIERVEHYLRMPPRQPAYRQGRPHGAFLTNLPASAADLKSRLRTAWNAETDVTAYPEAAVAELVEQKYSRLEWTRRR
jgi:lipoate---protein ligase